MEAYDLFVVEQFLRIKDKFKREHHSILHSQLHDVYLLGIWLNLPPTRKQSYHLQAKHVAQESTLSGKTLLPILINDHLQLIEVQVDGVAITTTSTTQPDRTCSMTSDLKGNGINKGRWGPKIVCKGRLPRPSTNINASISNSSCTLSITEDSVLNTPEEIVVNAPDETAGLNPPEEYAIETSKVIDLDVGVLSQVPEEIISACEDVSTRKDEENLIEKNIH